MMSFSSLAPSIQVGNDGTVSFRNRERISFDYILSRKFAGDLVDVEILRDKKRLSVQVEARPLSHLVPIQQYDLLPRFFIYAGLVFTPLSQPYLHEYGEDWYNVSPRRLCERALMWEQETEGQELVILSQVLQHKCNEGYEALCNLQVWECNGEKVRCAIDSARQHYVPYCCRAKCSGLDLFHRSLRAKKN